MVRPTRDICLQKGAWEIQTIGDKDRSGCPKNSSKKKYFWMSIYANIILLVRMLHFVKPSLSLHIVQHVTL